MTYQSKAALREEILELQAKLRRASADRKLHEVDIKLAKEYSAFTTRRDSLELVLKALKIPGYTSTVYGSKVYAADRFQADLETALRVRAEKAKAAEDAAIEARVAELGKKASPMYASGGYTGYSGTLFGHAYPGETIHSANDVKSQGAENLEYFSKLARTYLTPQPETVEKNIKKSKGDKK